MGIIAAIINFFTGGSGEALPPFPFPIDYTSPWEREAYCLRYQEVQHERAIAGDITEYDRAVLVSAMLPHLRIARKNSQNGKYTGVNPPLFIAKKGDWDGEKILYSIDFNFGNKSAILHYSRRVMALNMSSPDIDKISAEVGMARAVCLYDTRFDKDINDV